MIEVRCGGAEDARGASFPLTFEDAAKIAKAEPPAVRGSSQGIPLFAPPEPPPAEPSEPKQQVLF